MGAAMALEELARSVTGPPGVVLRRLLVLVCEQLEMDIAYITLLNTDGTRTVRLAVTAGGADVVAAEGLTEPLAQTWCSRVLAERVSLVADAEAIPELMALPTTAAFAIRSHAGVVLERDGVDLGTLCALSHRSHPTLNARDGSLLDAVAAVAVDQLVLLDHALVPGQRRSPEVDPVTDVVARATSLEHLSRSLLDALQELTGLASTYLTVIHTAEGAQEIRFSRNVREGFALPEGLRVPWEDTLCKRALDEGRPCTTEVPELWGDSAAARALGIQVYVSVPVELSDGTVWGTLCAADSERAEAAADHLPTMRLFSRLIAAEVERSAVLARAEREAADAQRRADTDPLTGCASRGVVEPWLDDRIAALQSDEVVLVGFLDVDDFKLVNDGLGHAAGDLVLVEVGRTLTRLSRPGDLVARLGGDEFVLAAVVPRRAAAALARRVRGAGEVLVMVGDAPRRVHSSIGVAMADRGSAAQLLAAADGAMYAVKRG